MREGDNVHAPPPSKVTIESPPLHLILNKQFYFILNKTIFGLLILTIKIKVL